MAVTSPARLAAAKALRDVEEGEYADVALENYLPKSGKDVALAWNLTLGVLRNDRVIDAALRERLKQPIHSLDPVVRMALRLGTYELLFTRIPKHASIHQSVEVCKRLGNRRAHGLVNAVLRRVTEPEEMSVAERINQPDWLFERWSQRFGEVRTVSWCELLTIPPPTSIVFRDDPAPWLTLWKMSGATWHHQSDVHPPLTGELQNHRGRITDLAGFTDGAFWVQDPSSVAVADFLEVAPGATVLDACAAPGGKTFRLLSQGAEVTCVDRSAKRLKVLEENALRLKATVGVATHDWEKGPMPAPEGQALSTFDAVLVDAPCSALGTIRRHPELKWRRQPHEFAKLADRQLTILQSASAHLKPSGTLVYAVCSPEPEEGEQVIAQFLEGNSEFVLEKEWLSAPPRYNEDAFFAARLKKCAADSNGPPSA